MNQFDHLRSRLEEEKVELERQLATVGRPNPATSGDWEPVQTDAGQESDLGDRADLLEQFEANSSILHDLELRYADVQAALARLADGSYGTCTVSGEEIEMDRLEADPAAKTCKAHMG